jgi:UDP-3-O-[3-hydroxymyristoyl] glucosamine N-acyltransferase
VERTFALESLAQRVGGVVRGDPAIRIHGIATLEQAGPHQLSFLTHPRYRKSAETTRAAAVLVGPASGLAGHALLEVSQPQLALAQLLELFHPPCAPPPGVSPDARLGRGVELGQAVSVGPFAVIGDQCVVGNHAVIGAGCVLGEGCHVGSQTVLHPRVVLYAGTRLGERCLIHAGVVLGGDGFGFVRDKTGHRKVIQAGCVVVEDDVEIGSNSTVDRATLGETRVGRGSKIDNLVMIAHGVELGADSLLAGQSGIAGSTRLGAGSILAGQAGVAGHLELGAEVRVAAKSAVFDDLAAGAFVAGIPAVAHLRWKRSSAMLERLPLLRRQVRELQVRLAALEARLGSESES